MPRLGGGTCNLAIVDELAAPNMLMQYSLHAPRRGREDIKSFMTDFRRAFPDLNFWGAADLIAEGDYVAGRWEGRRHAYGAGFLGFLDRITTLRGPAPSVPGWSQKTKSQITEVSKSKYELTVRP
jgi:hypothetical protein